MQQVRNTFHHNDIPTILSMILDLIIINYLFRYLSNFIIFSILSRIITVSDDIQQFRRNLTESKSVSRGEKPKLQANVLERTIDDDSKRKHQPNLENLKENQCQMDCTLKSPSMTSRKIGHSETSNSTKTSSLKASDTSSKESSSGTTNHPNGKEILNHVSDDPSAPIYPPRSPTSEIVPKELQPCH